MIDLKGEPPDPRDLLTRHGLRPKRAFSQNFLVQPASVARIADATVELGRVVVEFGAGLGTLTHALIARGCEVTAVELDRDLVAVLEREYGHDPRLRLIAGDAAELDLQSESARRGTRLVVAGNLPYQATGAILRRIVDDRNALDGAVLMVQREVRDRLAAEPATPAYGALTVFVQAAFDVQTLFRLRPGCFYPAPNVDSAVVCLTPRPEPRAVENDAFRAVVRAAFQTRRKTLRNALRTLGDPTRAEQALTTAQIDPSRRGETLTIEEFARLAEAWTTTP